MPLKKFSHRAGGLSRISALPMIAAALLISSAAALAVAPPAGESNRGVAAGKSRFEKLCVACHGQDGVGGKGPSLQRTGLEEAFIRQRIIEGKHGDQAMPPWGTVLSADAIEDLVAYVRWLGEHKGEAAKAAVTPFALNDPARIEAGRKRFNKTCAGYCHGFEGKGGRAPDFKGRTDLPIQVVFDTITHGRTGADVMPPWGGAFSDEQIWELVAYIQYLGTQKDE